MKLPYGLSNFADVRTEGYFYVDKTPFLPELEQLLEHYYDLARADRFDELFRGLWIHDHPTPERNRYLVLPLDFSQVAVDGGADALRRSFLDVVKDSVLRLIASYHDRIPELGWLLERIEGYPSAEAVLGRLMAIVSASGQKLYVLIDEYDNFANRLLSDGSQSLYTSIVERTGFVRTFYATLKAGTASGAVSRIFIAGVAPLLVDDLSSGFNIATNISLYRAFNTLAGFTHADVDRAVDTFMAARPALASQPPLSLLYYLGLLTLGPEPPDRHPAVFGYRLDIPNRIIRELVWEHLAILLNEESLNAGTPVFVGAKEVLFRSWPEEPPRRRRANPRARRSRAAK
jgi:hypothetical protein